MQQVKVELPSGNKKLDTSFTTLIPHPISSHINVSNCACSWCTLSDCKTKFSRSQYCNNLTSSCFLTNSYTNSYPLLVVNPQGVKKMGELELAVRFSCASTLNLMHAYFQSQLPRMHFFYPLDPKHSETLRVAAMNIVALKLIRSEPPLRQEVVQFMLDTEAERWSMRRSKANYCRIMVYMAIYNLLQFERSLFRLSCPWRKKVTAFLNEGTRAGAEAQVWKAARCGWSTSKCTLWTCHHRWTVPFSPQSARSQVWLPFPCQKGCLKAVFLTNEIFLHLVIARIPTLFSSVCDTQHIWFLLIVCLTGLLQYS